MRRFFAVLLVAAGICSAAGGLAFDEMPTPWWFRGMTLQVPMNDPGAPLKTIRAASALSLTRAGATATYLDPLTGLVTAADENVVRYETGGVLIEAAATNLLLYSEDLTNAAWGPAGTISITADNVEGPDGAKTAERITGWAGYPTGYFTQVLSGLTPSTRYEVSIYMSRGDLHDDFTWGSWDGGGYGYCVVDLDTTPVGWFRVARYATGITYYNDWMSNSGGGTGTYFGGGGFNDPADVFYATFGQVEIGQFSTSYIKTTSAPVTRNGDVLKVASAGHVSAAASTVALEWAPLFSSTMTGGAAYVLFDVGTAKGYYNATDQKMYLTDGTNTIASAALTFSFGVPQKLAFRWGASGLAIAKDGAVIASGNTYAAGTANANLYVGSDLSGANQAHGHYRNLRAFDREFSDTEMVAISL